MGKAKPVDKATRTDVGVGQVVGPGVATNSAPLSGPCRMQWPSDSRPARAFAKMGSRLPQQFTHKGRKGKLRGNTMLVVGWEMMAKQRLLLISQVLTSLKFASCHEFVHVFVHVTVKIICSAATPRRASLKVPGSPLRSLSGRCRGFPSGYESLGQLAMTPTRHHVQSPRELQPTSTARRRKMPAALLTVLGTVRRTTHIGGVWRSIRGQCTKRSIDGPSATGAKKPSR
jgi:hypothetical protein